MGAAAAAAAVDDAAVDDDIVTSAGAGTVANVGARAIVDGVSAGFFVLFSSDFFIASRCLLRAVFFRISLFFLLTDGLYSGFMLPDELTVWLTVVVSISVAVYTTAEALWLTPIISNDDDAASTPAIPA